MPRVDSGYPCNFRINSRLFKDDESETEAKTNSGHRVCLLLACTEHAQHPPLACCVSIHSHKFIFSLTFLKIRPRFLSGYLKIFSILIYFY